MNTLPPPRLRGLAIAALCVVAATCRLDDLCGPGCGTGAILQVSPADSLTDSAVVGSTAPRVDTINIENKGDGDLRWSARVLHASPWLSLQPDTGTAGQSAPLQVRADPTGLALGVYRDTVVVAASGSGVQEVPVVFRIHP
jgi:hypothetical protein